MKVIIYLLKIIATVILSIMIIIGLIRLFPLAEQSDNVLIKVFIPCVAYTFICFIGIYLTWSYKRK